MPGKSKAQALDAITHYPTFILLASSFKPLTSRFQPQSSAFRIQNTNCHVAALLAMAVSRNNTNNTKK